MAKQLGSIAWTPGPWVYSECDGLVFAADGTGITDVDTAAVEDESARDAIGQLIAAAPELYDALSRLPFDAFDKDEGQIDAADFVDNASAFMEAIFAARAAMAKARGEAPDAR